MPAPKCTDQEFIEFWRKFQSNIAVADHLGMTPAMCRTRKKRIEKRYDIQLPQADHRKAYNTAYIPEHRKARVTIDLPNGHIVVFSDAHYYPGEPTTAHKGLVRVLRRIKPEIVICNGDAFDGSSISRFPRIGWDNNPTVKQELDAVTDRLTEVENVSNQAKLFWPLGNHDARYETFLAARAPEYEGVPGFSLKDKFPRWTPCWSIMVNANTMIKHRYHMGIHAAYNNTLRSGTSIITGHLHSLKVTPWSDYNGDRYGVDSGTIAQPYGPQFTNYTEDNPVNWRSGFVVLTFVNSKLMPPELAQVIEENKLFFRGEVINV